MKTRIETSPVSRFRLHENWPCPYLSWKTLGTMQPNATVNARKTRMTRLGVTARMGGV